MPLTDERLRELLRHKDIMQQVREANGLAGDPDVVAVIRELLAYRAEADAEHPMGVSLKERVAERLREDSPPAAAAGPQDAPGHRAG